MVPGLLALAKHVQVVRTKAL